MECTVGNIFLSLLFNKANAGHKFKGKLFLDILKIKLEHFQTELGYNMTECD